MDRKSIVLYINKFIKKFKLYDSKLIGPYKSACQIYQSADAYITTKYLDPCPNSVIEAMFVGYQ